MAVDDLKTEIGRAASEPSNPASRAEYSRDEYSRAEYTVQYSVLRGRSAIRSLLLLLDLSKHPAIAPSYAGYSPELNV